MSEPRFKAGDEVAFKVYLTELLTWELSKRAGRHAIFADPPTPATHIVIGGGCSWYALDRSTSDALLQADCVLIPASEAIAALVATLSRVYGKSEAEILNPTAAAVQA